MSGEGMSEYQPRWQTDPKRCSHTNDDVCPTCDFDSYYALTYQTCPWRAKRLSDLGLTVTHPTTTERPAAEAVGESEKP